MTTAPMADWEPTNQLAKERGLDPRRLYIALIWYGRQFGDKAAEIANAGTPWEVKDGKIKWLDREDPNRFVLGDFYEAAR